MTYAMMMAIKDFSHAPSKSMNLDPNETSFWTAFAAISGAGVGAFGTMLGHLFRSRASMAAIVDARIKLLIEGYENRIDELRLELREARAEILDLNIKLGELKRALPCTGDK